MTRPLRSSIPPRRAPLIRFLLLASTLLLLACWAKPERTFRTVDRPTSAPIPTVQAVVPPSGPTAGGTPVTLFGSDFRPGLRVFFGGSEAAVLLVTAGTARVLTPAYPAGPASLRVRNADGTHAIVEDGFAFTDGAPVVPEILGASLAVGPPAGGPSSSGGGISSPGRRSRWALPSLSLSSTVMRA